MSVTTLYKILIVLALITLGGFIANLTTQSKIYDPVIIAMLIGQIGGLLQIISKQRG